MSPSASVVFLVHGFRSDASAVGYMARMLSTQHRVVTVDLPLTYQSLERCVKALHELVSETIEKHPVRRMNFIGHSTGGLIIRMLLGIKPIADLTAACVLVAVPNKGAMLADAYESILLKQFRVVYRPIEQLTPEFVTSMDLTCPPHIAMGGIAGLRYWGGGTAYRGPNDGVVEVSSVYLDEMVDFIRLPFDHLTIMQQYVTARACLAFMETLSFPDKLRG